MTLLDIVSIIREGERVTIVGDEVLVDRMPSEWLLASDPFRSKLAPKEVDCISIGHLHDLIIRIKE